MLFPALLLLALSGVAHILIPGALSIARFLGPVALFFVGSITLLIALGEICVGWGLMEHRPWARSLAIVLGVIALLKFPIGTALGIYTLWVLSTNEAAVEYARLAGA